VLNAQSQSFSFTLLPKDQCAARSIRRNVRRELLSIFATQRKSISRPAFSRGSGESHALDVGDRALAVPVVLPGEKHSARAVRTGIKVVLGKASQADGTTGARPTDARVPGGGQVLEINVRFESARVDPGVVGTALPVGDRLFAQPVGRSGAALGGVRRPFVIERAR